MMLLLFTDVAYAQNLEVLLNELAQKDDLSVHTKKESGGYLTIFTRQDLDRMKIHSFKELIEKIPFQRYNEDARGLSAPYYQPYQLNDPSRIRIFINDRELISPLFGGGLQLAGQMDMAYIDHVEVYMGIPSYDISIEPSVVVIKAYTKTGSRENTSMVGLSGGSYGANNAYAYRSEDLKDFSYFVYADHLNLKRKEFYNLGSKISRDKDIGDLYAQVTFPKSRLEFQAIKTKMDNFIGSSWNITPKNSNTNFEYLNFGYNYHSLDKSLKAFVNYSYLKDRHQDSSSSAPIGLSKIPAFPFYIPFYSSSVDISEHLLDTQLTKKYEFYNASFLLGVKNRYKKFIINRYTRDGVDFPIGTNYSSEDIASIFGEYDYLINSKNRFILSANMERYIENSRIKGENVPSFRLGYIYHSDNFTQKSFIFYGKFRPTTEELFQNDILSQGHNQIKSEGAVAISTQSSWQYKNSLNTLLIARTYLNDFIYFDGTGFRNNSDQYVFDTASFKTVYSFSALDKIEFNAWVSSDDYGKSSSNRHEQKYGGYLALFKNFSKIDTYNSISYMYGYDGKKHGWNYNATITYPYSKKLTFYLKGENLLNKAMGTDYYRINQITGSKTILNDISPFDRTVWFGLEYQF